jgi:hypothetical protein
MKTMSKQQIANLRSGQTVYRVCSPNGDDRMLGQKIMVLACCPVGKKRVHDRSVSFTKKIDPRKISFNRLVSTITHILFYDDRFFASKKDAQQYATALKLSRLLTRQRYPSRKRKQISDLYAQ